MPILSTLDDINRYKITDLPDSFYYIPNYLSSTRQSHILTSLPEKKWISLAHRRLQAHPGPLSKNNVLLSAPLPAYLTNALAPITSLDLFRDEKEANDENVKIHMEKNAANHCLVNEYLSGQGIMAHRDGEAYFPCVATISLGSSIVLDVFRPDNEHEEMGLRQDTSDGDSDTDKAFNTACQKSVRDPVAGRMRGTKMAPWRILQEPGSLLITTGNAYSHTMHGIAETHVDEDLDANTVANWDLLGDRKSIEARGGRSQRGTRTSLTYRRVLKTSDVATRLLGMKR